MIMSKSNNNHMWYGLLSTYTNQISKSLELSAGIDVRYYIGEHNNEIIDLYDGKYFIDDSSRANVKPEQNAAAADPNWVYEKLQVGDKVYRDYDGHVHQEGVFAQLEWTKKNLNAFVSGSVSNTGYWRYDRFYYDAAHAESEHVNFIGYTVKGGANYNINEKHNVFANLGYISRAPFFSGGAFLQSTTSNVKNPDPLNEKVFSAEIGYGFRSGILSVNLNGYYTLWMDKSVVRSSQRRLRPREPLGCRRTPHGPRTGLRPAPQPLAGRDRYAFAGRLAVGQRLEGLHLRHAGAAPDQGFGRHGRLGHHG